MKNLCSDIPSCSECRHYFCLYAVDTGILERRVSLPEMMALDAQEPQSDEEAASILWHMDEVEPCVVEDDGFYAVIWDDGIQYVRRF